MKPTKVSRHLRIPRVLSVVRRKARPRLRRCCPIRCFPRGRCAKWVLSLLCALRFAAAPFGIAQQLVTYEYGTSGERTSWRSRLDIDGDGVFEFDFNTQVTSQEFTDGVLMLGYQYFEGSEIVVVGGGVILGSAARKNIAAAGAAFRPEVGSRMTSS